MKDNRYIILMLCVCLGLVKKTFTQSIEELLEKAITSNQELRALQHSYQAALQKAPQVSQLPNPEIGIGAFILPIETRLGPQQGRLGITQMFPWFGTLKAQENLALTQAQVQLEQVAAQELEVRYRIAIACYKLYELQVSQKLIQKNITLFEGIRSLSEAKVSSGKSTLADVLRLDLKLDELKQQLQILENRKRKPLAEINQIVQRDVQTPVSVPDSLPFVEMNLSREEIVKEMRVSHPMVRMYELQQRAAQQAMEVNELQGRPSFGIGADYIQTGRRSDADPARNGRDAFLIRASVSIPLSQKKYRARDREEQYRMGEIEARKRETLSRFESMMEQAYADHEEARLNLKLYDRQIETTEAAIQVLEAQYAGQNQGFDELLQLEALLLEYQLRKLQAVVKSYIARASIERYILR